MAKLLNISIDVTKIDKSRLIKGKKGTYANLTIEVKDEKDQYDNDVSAWESQTKEERESTKPRNYLGNGRIIWSGEKKDKLTDPNDDLNDDEEVGDDLPF